VKGKISQAAKNDKENFGVLKLTGAGWKLFYETCATTACEKLHTPKFGNVTDLLHDWLGVDPSQLESEWRHDRDDLNAFVTLRGEIAHRGADATYVRVTALRHYREMVDELTVDTDRYLANYLQDVCGKRPWRNT
jgi:hypothetical protein